MSDWVKWLADSGYGYDWRADVDPPCTLAELADAYAEDEGDDANDYMWSIEAETGPWGRATTGRDK